MSDDKIPQELLAGLQLLDRQLVDADGFLAGKVDDLELEFDDDGDPDGRRHPVRSGCARGPGRADASASWIAVLHRRLQDAPGSGPARVPFELVTGIGTRHQARGAAAPSSRATAAKTWARDVIVSKIPGARHEAE